MKISYNWLRQYAPVDLSPERLADVLTMGGLEVDDIDRIGPTLDGVVVGHVLRTWRHPNADRLTLCEVDVGSGDPVQIACGAPNVATGQKVPVATVGTTLLLPSRQNPREREPITINRAKIRGEISEGMICAEDELGLSEDHGGIMVLRDDAEIGRTFADYLQASGVEVFDAVLDVGITPNRPDATSHIGVARDAAALFGTPLRVPKAALPREGGPAARQVQVKIQAPEGCPRYVAMIVRDIAVRESPMWLKQRLAAIGLRPRNNVVDVTNFVLHECGQPLHAFDYDKIDGAIIRVRRLDERTSFTTLDSRVRELPAGTLMICDAKREIAIAGIMGGENSEVTDETTNVLIESAYFEPKGIRKSAKALGLQTDASYRFERGVDRDGQTWAAARAAELIAQLGGGTIVEGMVDAHPLPYEEREIAVRPSRVTSLLGIEISAARIEQLLEAIGFDVREDAGSLLVTVPSFRPDVEREVDVIEEIVRLFGYDNIPEPQTSLAPPRTPHELPDDRLRRSTRALLSSIGYREIYTNTMQRAETARKFNHRAVTAGIEGEIVETLNPISQEMAALRPSLLPGALQAMSFNRKHGQRVLRFFEYGHVFQKVAESDNIIPGYAEHESMLIAVSGPAAAPGWDVPERLIDLYDLKGVVEALIDSLRIADVRFKSDYRPTEITSYQLGIFSGTTSIGVLAKVSDAVADAYDLKEPVFFAELDFPTIVALAAPLLDRRYRGVSRYPAVERDIAVVVDRGEPAGEMMRTIRRAGGELLRHVGVFDLYEGERMEPGKKSVAFTLRFAGDRTLTDEEVDDRVRAIVAEMASVHDALLRS